MPVPSISLLSSQHELVFLPCIRVFDPGGREFDDTNRWTSPEHPTENRMPPMKAIFLPKRRHMTHTQTFVRAPQMA